MLSKYSDYPEGQAALLLRDVPSGEKSRLWFSDHIQYIKVVLLQSLNKQPWLDIWLYRAENKALK